MIAQIGLVYMRTRAGIFIAEETMLQSAPFGDMLFTLILGQSVHTESAAGAAPVKPCTRVKGGSVSPRRWSSQLSPQRSLLLLSVFQMRLR